MDEDRRQNERKTVVITTVLRKKKADGSTVLMEFRSRDLSMGGIFISTEDLSIFDLGEDVEILVEVDGEKFYEGKAAIVRSARILSEEGEKMGSGFGVMFLEPTDEFKSAVAARIEMLD